MVTKSFGGIKGFGSEAKTDKAEIVPYTPIGEEHKIKKSLKMILGVAGCLLAVYAGNYAISSAKASMYEQKLRKSYYESNFNHKQKENLEKMIGHWKTNAKKFPFTEELGLFKQNDKHKTPEPQKKEAIPLEETKRRQHLAYHFDGKIEGEKVKFYEKGYYDINNDDVNILQIVKVDRTEVTYYDIFYDDLKIEGLTIGKNGEVCTSYFTPVCLFQDYSEEKKLKNKTKVEEAQKEFDNYLKKILEQKTLVKN